MNYNTSRNGIAHSNYGVENSHQQNRTNQVMIVSCIVKADDTSKESIELSSKLGLRLRKILSDQSVTASSFARSFVENSKSYLRAVCDELSGDSNCNVTMSYGNGNTTQAMIRYNEKAGQPVFIGSLLMQIKIAENDMTSVILPKDKLYTQVQSYGSFPPEIYITPAKSAPLWEISCINGSDGEEEEEGESIILLKVNNEGEICSVKVDPSNKDVKEFTKFDTTATTLSAEMGVNASSSENDDPPVPPKSKRKAETQELAGKASKKKTETKEAADKLTKSKKKVETKEAAEKSTKRKAETKELTEKTPKRSKDAKKKQADKEVAESSDKTSSKKAKSRSASIVDEKEANEPSEQPSPKKTKPKSRSSASIVEEKEDIDSSPISKKTTKPKQKRKESIGEEEHLSAKKKTKAKKDPNAPKRSLSTYMLFCKDARAKVLKEHPDAKVPEMGKLLGAKYKELSKDEKLVYEIKSSLLKKQYDLDKAEYAKHKIDAVVEDDIESVNSAELEAASSTKKKKRKTPVAEESDNEEDKGDANKGKKKKKDKDPNAPKRPLTKYMLFCKDQRLKVMEENPGIKVPAIGKILGTMYRKISDEESAKYVNAADKLKSQYFKDKEVYEKKKPEVNHDDGDKNIDSDGKGKDREEETPKTVKKMKRSKNDGEEKDKEEEAPKTVKKKKRSKKNPLAPKRALSAYMFFCTSKRAELKTREPKLTVPEMGKLLGKMWQDISVEDRTSFDEMATKDKERYTSDMKTFDAI